MIEISYEFISPMIDDETLPAFKKKHNMSYVFIAGTLHYYYKFETKQDEMLFKLKYGEFIIND